MKGFIICMQYCPYIFKYSPEGYWKCTYIISKQVIPERIVTWFYTSSYLTQNNFIKESHKIFKDDV